MSHNKGMQVVIPVAACLVLMASGAFAQISPETQARIERVRAERDVKMMNRYQEEVKAAKGNPAALNTVQQKFSPMFDNKAVIGTDPALPPKQQMKLRVQNLYNQQGYISETAADMSSTTIRNWSEEVARDHAVDSFRDKDTKSMKMMFDARRDELKDAQRK